MRPLRRPRLLTQGLLIGVTLAAIGVSAPDAQATRRFPNIVVVAVDTLRYDHLSIHGHPRPTSPYIDALLRGGARFTRAHVVEPLTAPSMASIFTGLYPHEHGASRNGLHIRPGLPSLPKILARRGYKTSAVVGNWTLRAELLGLDEHFGSYEGVWSRKRYFGFANSEATAHDLNETANRWVDDHLAENGRYPFFLWVHYVEPHNPYRFHDEYAERLRIGADPKPRDRYDTEIAFVDEAIGRLLQDLRRKVPLQDLLVIFVSDHGESLGEHNYWGHGRHLYQPTLHIPLGFYWHGRIVANTVIEAPATSLDIASTVLGLVGLPVPDSFRGFDFSRFLLHETAKDMGSPPMERTTFHEAHKGASHGNEDRARRNGLLEVGLVEAGRHKEILRVKKDRLRVYDLATDAGEDDNLASKGRLEPSDELLAFWRRVQEGLDASDELPAQVLTEEDVEQLRALGYID
ncbi:MAG: sulfatase [Thermoanaerobaculia bacterium]|nr:sulfatase [Thermoanaerobaculia bacterium]